MKFEYYSTGFILKALLNHIKISKELSEIKQIIMGLLDEDQSVDHYIDSIKNLPNVFNNTEFSNSVRFAAEFLYAICVQFGIGVKMDFSESVALSSAIYQRLSEKNYVPASHMYGDYCQNNGNFEKALQCYKVGVEENYAPAQDGLARLYYFGNGVEINFKMALELFEKSAAQEYAPAELFLGDYYAERADATQATVPRVYDLLTRAYKHGYTIAKDSLEKLPKKLFGQPITTQFQGLGSGASCSDDVVDTNERKQKSENKSRL